jgi:hypothetical protein
MKLAGAGAGLALLVACLGCTPVDASVGTIASAIVYGELSPDGGVEDGVLLLRTTVDGGELLCSASLVAPNLVLTARHCMAHLVQGRFNCTVRGELVDNPDGGGRLGLDLPAETIEIYDGSTPRNEPLAHGVRTISTLSPTVCLNDIAFLVLDRSLNLPPLALRRTKRTRAGEPATLVGYGLDETQGDFIDYRTQRRRRKTDLAVYDVGPDSIDDGVTTVAPRTLIVKGPSGCTGDSGGPLLSNETKALIGVYSTFDGTVCTDRDGRQEFVEISPFGVLIDQAFAAAGATSLDEPLPEPEPEPLDARGEASTMPEASHSPPRQSTSGCSVASGLPRRTSLAGAGMLAALAAAVSRRGVSDGPRAGRWRRRARALPARGSDAP